jgi:hypothetical protein
MAYLNCSARKPFRNSAGNDANTARTDVIVKCRVPMSNVPSILAVFAGRAMLTNATTSTYGLDKGWLQSSDGIAVAHKQASHGMVPCTLFPSFPQRCIAVAPLNNQLQPCTQPPTHLHNEQPSPSSLQSTCRPLHLSTTTHIRTTDRQQRVDRYRCPAIVSLTFNVLITNPPMFCWTTDRNSRQNIKPHRTESHLTRVSHNVPFPTCLRTVETYGRTKQHHAPTRPYAYMTLRCRPQHFCYSKLFRTLRNHRGVPRRSLLQRFRNAIVVQGSVLTLGVEVIYNKTKKKRRSQIMYVPPKLASSRLPSLLCHKSRSILVHPESIFVTE